MLSLLLCLAFSSNLNAERPRNTGLIVSIPTTITTQSTQRLSSAFWTRYKRYEERRNAGERKLGKFHLVCDFNPAGRPSQSNDFGACYDLAKFLRSLQDKGVWTVAWVHGDVTRHSVLPVLVCNELRMSRVPMARIGAVTDADLLRTDADHPLRSGGVERLAYETMPRNVPPVIVRKMYDPSVKLIKVKFASTKDNNKQWEAYRDASVSPNPITEDDARELQRVPVPVGDKDGIALYSFLQARTVGLCADQEVNNLETLLASMERSSLSPPLDHVVAWRIVVQGQITEKLKEQFKRRIQRAVGHKANLLIVQLECSGGDSQAAYEMGLELAKLSEQESPIQTIAYLTRQARDTATFLALGCHKMVMQQPAEEDLKRQANNPNFQPPPLLGGFADYLSTHPRLGKLQDDVDPNTQRQRSQQEREGLEQRLSKNLADLARRQHHSPLLVQAMVQRSLAPVEVVSTRGSSVRRFLTREAFEEDQKGERQWRKVSESALTDSPETYVTLTANQAETLGLADEVVADYPELCSREGIDLSKVRTADIDWLDQLADFLKHPWTSIVLVMLGITCLILELKMPGVGLPGVISAICFVLFFWAHSAGGQITWLALLLFLLGLVLVILEVFVLPGTGVCGVSGVLLILVSLGLMAYGQWPRHSTDFLGVGEKIGMFGLSMLGAVILAFTIARYLPHIPFVNRLLLRPPDESDEDQFDLPDHTHDDLATLLGAIGVTATPLRPAGKVQFGESFVDVVADSGNYVHAGLRVQVVEIEGNRVMVKEV